MPYENFRSISSTKSTIPEPTTLDGTVEGVTKGNGKFYLLFTPAVAPASQSLWDNFKPSDRNRQWVYLPNDDLLVQVLAIEATELQVDQDVSTVAATAVFQKVNARLKAYTIANTGGAAGTLNGQSFAANGTKDVSISKENGQTFMSPVLVDASSTTIEVVEQS